MQSPRNMVALQHSHVTSEEVLGRTRPRRQFKVGQVVVQRREYRRIGVEFGDAFVGRPIVESLHRHRVLVGDPALAYVRTQHWLGCAPSLVHVVRDVWEEVSDVMVDEQWVVGRARRSVTVRTVVGQVQLMVTLVQSELWPWEVTVAAVRPGEVRHPREDWVVIRVARPAPGEPIQQHQVVEVWYLAVRPHLNNFLQVAWREGAVCGQIYWTRCGMAPYILHSIVMNTVITSRDTELPVCGIAGLSYVHCREPHPKFTVDQHVTQPQVTDRRAQVVTTLYRSQYLVENKQRRDAVTLQQCRTERHRVIQRILYVRLNDVESVLRFENWVGIREIRVRGSSPGNDHVTRWLVLVGRSWNDVAAEDSLQGCSRARDQILKNAQFLNQE